MQRFPGSHAPNARCLGPNVLRASDSGEASLACICDPPTLPMRNPIARSKFLPSHPSPLSQVPTCERASHAIFERLGVLAIFCKTSLECSSDLIGGPDITRVLTSACRQTQLHPLSRDQRRSKRSLCVEQSQQQ